MLIAAPGSVTMTFKENLTAAPGSFISISTGGKDATSGDSAVSSGDTKTMSIKLTAGSANGKYNVFWKRTSADDGGVTFGSFAFFVGQPDPADLASTPSGAAVAVPDAATAMALSAGGTMTVKLAAGCNLVALTLPEATPAATVAAAIAPAGTVNIWQYDAAASKCSGCSNAAGAQNDLKTVNRLAAVWICVSSTGALVEPAA